MNTYQDLIAWQRSFALTKEIYRLTKEFPAEEKYGIVSQMRRAAVSVPSNIAEGYRRRHQNERRQFMSVAYGSASELETQFLLSKDLFALTDQQVGIAESLLQEVLRLLNRLCQSYD